MSDDYKLRRIGERSLSPESLMMGYGYDPTLSEGALKSPIFQTSTFVFESAEEGKAFFEVAYGLRQKRPHETVGLIYSRLNNPDLEILEDRLALWDDAETAAAFESGMAAISTTLFTFLEPGDLILFSEPVYGGTEYLLHEILPRFGIEVACWSARDGREGLERALETPGVAEKLRMIYVETPANPTNDLVDIAHCRALADAHAHDERGVLVAVDNTFLGPLWQHPLEHGADLVIYSLTKYVGGHSDLVAGACLGSEDLVSRVKVSRTFFGSMAGAWTCWLLLRSLETMKLRMTCQAKNARYVADFLAEHPKVRKVNYLGHIEPDDPRYEVFDGQCLGTGGMISFHIRGGEAEAFRFLNSLKLAHLAVSLGGTETLAEHPATMTHSDVAPEDQERMGITPDLVRLSIGVENPQDLIADVAQALDAV